MHTARIAHHIPGRLRIVIATARRDMRVLTTVAGEIEKLASVRAVDINPMAASLVVRYEEGGEDLPLAVRALGLGLQLFELSLDVRNSPAAIRRRIDRRGSELGRELLTAAKLLNREMKLATGGTVDLRLLVPLGTAALTALNARQASGPTPLWLTLVTFAFNSFVALHRGVALEMTGAAQRSRED